MTRSYPTPRGALGALALALLGLPAAASAQYEAHFATVGGQFSQLPSALQSFTSPTSIDLWTASGQDGWCQGWISNSNGSVSTSAARLAVDSTTRKQAGCATDALSLVISRIECDDLVFELAGGGGSGTIPVMLPAGLTIAADLGYPGNPDDGLHELKVGVCVANSPEDLVDEAKYKGTTTDPGEFHDLTQMSVQPLGQVLEITFELQVIAVSTQGGDPLGHDVIDQAAALRLGDPATGELFVLPPGVTANAPSIGLVDNVLTEPWVDLGGGSSGVAGPPTLTGGGTLTAGGPVSLALTDAPPSAPMLAWVSFAPTPFGALGGTVHAFPYASQLFLGADGAGDWGATTTWPAVPVGTQVWFQFIVQDASVPDGLTLSNGLRATTQ